MVMEIETTPALSPLYNHMKKYDTIIQIGSKGDLRKVSITKIIFNAAFQGIHQSRDSGVPRKSKNGQDC